MSTKITGGTTSSLWSAFDAGASNASETKEEEAVEEAAPVAAVPGSSTALYELFRSQPASDGKDEPVSGAAAERNAWLGYVNFPTLNQNTNEDD